MAYWQSNYNPDEQLFHEINKTIECVRHELHQNHFALQNELVKSIPSESDRVLVAAELFKQRLMALTQASRDQLVMLTSRFWRQAMAQERNYNVNHRNIRSYPKPRRFNNYVHCGADTYQNNSHRYGGPQNNWNPNPYYHNRYYCKTNFKRNCKRKRTNAFRRNIVTVKTIPTLAKTTTDQVKTTALVKTTTAPVKITNALRKTTTAVKTSGPIPAVAKTTTRLGETITAPVKTLIAPMRTIDLVKTAVKSTITPVGTTIAPVQISSLNNNIAIKVSPSPAKTMNSVPKDNTSIFKDLSRFNLQFADKDRITIKSEVNVGTSQNVVKTEPNIDLMDDDLENHI